MREKEEYKNTAQCLPQDHPKPQQLLQRSQNNAAPFAATMQPQAPARGR